VNRAPDHSAGFDWDALSGSYVGLAFSTEWKYGYPLVLESLGQLSGSRILDFGCGDGKFTQVLGKLGAKAVGVDKSPKMVAAAKRRDGASTEFFEVINDDLSRFGPASFDAAVACWVFCAIPSKREIRDIAIEIDRVLDREGTLSILENNPRSFGQRFESFQVTRPKGFRTGVRSVVETCLHGPGATKLAFRDVYWPTKTLSETVASATSLRLVSELESKPAFATGAKLSSSARPFRLAVFRKP